MLAAVISSVPIAIVVFLFRKARVRSDMSGAWCCLGTRDANGAIEEDKEHMDGICESIVSERKDVKIDISKYTKTWDTSDKAKLTKIESLNDQDYLLCLLSFFM